jgi:hypothetical protein
LASMFKSIRANFKAERDQGWVCFVSWNKCTVTLIVIFMPCDLNSFKKHHWAAPRNDRSHIQWWGNGKSILLCNPSVLWATFISNWRPKRWIRWGPSLQIQTRTQKVVYRSPGK